MVLRLLKNLKVVLSPTRVWVGLAAVVLRLLKNLQVVSSLHRVMVGLAVEVVLVLVVVRLAAHVVVVMVVLVVVVVRLTAQVVLAVRLARRSSVIRPPKKPGCLLSKEQKYQV